MKRALAVGKFALFEDCGLGKTIQQLEWAQKVFEHTDQPVLILAPLAVISQTIKEGAKFGYKVVDYDEMLPNNIDECGIFITNYDNLPNIVVMRGFGTFFTKVKAQKVGKDFKNGGSIVIPEHKVVLFKASKDFKLKNITI